MELSALFVRRPRGIKSLNAKFLGGNMKLVKLGLIAIAAVGSMVGCRVDVTTVEYDRFDRWPSTHWHYRHDHWRPSRPHGGYHPHPDRTHVPRGPRHEGRIGRHDRPDHDRGGRGGRHGAATPKEQSFVANRYNVNQKTANTLINAVRELGVENTTDGLNAMGFNDVELASMLQSGKISAEAMKTFGRIGMPEDSAKLLVQDLRNTLAK